MSAEAAAPAVPGPLGAIDGVFGERGAWIAVAPEDATVIVRGWAVDAGAHAFAALECGIGAARAEAPEEEQRPDVAAALGAPAGVGFIAHLRLAEAGLGRVPVTITGLRADGTRVPVPVDAALDVVPALAALPALPAGIAAGSVDEVVAEAEALRGSPGEILTVPLRGVLLVRGWAASPDGAPAEQAYAQIDGDRVVRGMAGYPRPDVALAAVPAIARTYGFRIRVPAAALGAGPHTLRVLVAAGGALCPVGEPVPFAVAAEPEIVPARSARHGRVDLAGRVDADRRVLDQRAGLRLRPDDRLVVSGWAGDAERATLPDLVLLTVDDAVHGAVRRGLVRPDVVDATGCRALEGSGFSTVIHAERLAEGQHQADLIAVYGEDVVLFDGFSFEVRR